MWRPCFTGIVSLTKTIIDGIHSSFSDSVHLLPQELELQLYKKCLMNSSSILSLH